MTTYLSTPTRGTTGVLLVNLGTPTAPTPAAVRRFLAEFLGDRRVVELPPLLWWPILHGIVLRTRPKKSAHAYAQVWTPRGSPLMTQSRALRDALEEQLRGESIGDVAVMLAMTYGEPSIASALRGLRDRKVDRIVVVPLYPQYSGTTSASVFDRVTKELLTWRSIPSLHFVADYHDDANYIQALAHSVREHWHSEPRDHLFMSFHGVPQRCIDQGDPYLEQCQRTAVLLANALDLKRDEWSMAFQSRFGRVKWITPYTEDVLRSYPRQGKKNLTVLCPGFATDCLETLEEIALRSRADFLAAGGERFSYVPCLNARPSHALAMAQLVRQHLPSSAPPNSLARTA